MSRGGAKFRGQPLVLLGVLLTSWLGMRVALWQSPWQSGGGFALASSHMERLQPVQVRQRQDLASMTERGAAFDSEAPALADPPAGWFQRPLPAPMPARPGWERLPLFSPIAQAHSPEQGAAAAPGEARSAAPRNPSTVGPVVGHNLLMMAGLQGELPEALVAALQRNPGPRAMLARRPDRAPGVEAAPAPAGTVPNRAPGGSRWSADAWVLLRDDSDAPLLLGQGAYGRSQAGAVLRYRLAPGSGRAPQAYLRASAALAGADDNLRDREVAVGLSARPLPSVPVRVAAEARITDTAGGSSVRPAVYAVTELNPVALPLGARGEVYLQGGYVGGDFATAFVDGQARVDRSLGRAGPAEFFAGAATWGGAQEGASRLDVGPSVAAAVGLGRLRGRLTADYRFRVAGESRPGSGPALTLYAGF